ncbi:hypothetical protein SNEBB_008962 [Seison nebaliae]|nr:hypothetical protein SNEBB_008962 [Seison nebaliae]
MKFWILLFCYAFPILYTSLEGADTCASLVSTTNNLGKKILQYKCNANDGNPIDVTKLFISRGDLFTEIDMQPNNYKEVPPIFHHYHNVETVKLGNNQLTTINEEFSDLNKLKVLLLNNNEIEEMKENSFANAKSIEVLDLSHNKLTNISWKILDSLNNLKILKLNSNKLKRISLLSIAHISNKLTILELEDNEIIEINSQTTDEKINNIISPALSIRLWKQNSFIKISSELFSILTIHHQNRLIDVLKLISNDSIEHQKFICHNNILVYVKDVQLDNLLDGQCSNNDGNFFRFLNCRNDKICQDPFLNNMNNQNPLPEPEELVDDEKEEEANGKMNKNAPYAATLLLIPLVILIVLLSQRKCREKFFMQTGFHPFDNDPEYFDMKQLDAIIFHTKDGSQFVDEKLSGELQDYNTITKMIVSSNTFSQYDANELSRAKRVIICLTIEFVTLAWADTDLQQAIKELLKTKQTKIIVIHVHKINQRELKDQFNLTCCTSQRYDMKGYGNNLRQKLFYAMPQKKPINPTNQSSNGIPRSIQRRMHIPSYSRKLPKMEKKDDFLT